MKWLVTFASIALLTAGAAAIPPDRNKPAADQYLVKSLPQVNFQIPKSWAGSLKVGSGYGDDSLFFWLWEAETQQGKNDLIIWFNGGPACSSLLGLFKMHGPVTFPRTSKKPQPNPYSWTRGANVVYIDQPIGTGFSTGTSDNTNMERNNAAVVKWLDSFFNVFPEMRSKKIHLMGESYAGLFLPYIAKEIQAQKPTLKAKLSSLSLGDSFWGNWAAMGNVPALAYIDEHRSNYATQMPADIYQALKKGDKDCGFPAVRAKITYPSSGPIIIPGNPSGVNFKRGPPPPPPPGYIPEQCDFDGGGTDTPERLAYIINHTECFGVCDPYDAAYNYYYSATVGREFNAYNINEHGYTGLYSDADYTAYLNRADVQAAIHAPRLQFTACNDDLRFAITGADRQNKPQPPSYTIVPTLISQGVKVHIFNGMLDFLIPHNGQELAIQNMTWAGTQGLTRPPTSDVLRSKSGQKVAQGREERGLSYYTFDDAGHRVAQDAPEAALQWLVKVVVKGPNAAWAWSLL
ncbi:hypothetical protein V495_06514 [Pseudogymnoascus sp. VKM F-4514 (FW-929)]|nr:hypothetical protein V490_07596 [Pseudogymnoascus sp. VKM F-3557]KFY38502.1 hypothetical protein V495_06514 [Pseudogymnoascus sp. VKM F-4514 (FW-929)]KFY51756.1 hypothetical protein V497_08866 [Pseudogymnoascus sp. VKM F-4516 (FW-969)]